MFLRCLIDDIENLVEEFKEKEYICFYRTDNIVHETYSKELFTKKQLLQFMKEHEVRKMQIFKIKDTVKVNKIFEIQEN